MTASAVLADARDIMAQLRAEQEHECARKACAGSSRKRCHAGEMARMRCPHRSFTGAWDGPDYMCPYCESDEDFSSPLGLYRYALAVANRGVRSARKAATQEAAKAMWAAVMARRDLYGPDELKRLSVIYVDMWHSA